MTEIEELVERELLDSKISILKREAVTELNKYPRKILPFAALELGVGSFFLFGSDWMFASTAYSDLTTWLIGIHLTIGVLAFALGVHLLFDTFNFPREMRRKHPQIYGKIDA